jgi:cobalt/nickel transport system permease protein
LHHVVLDRWSRGASPLHRRDPRAKLIALIVLLVALATAQQGLTLFAAALLLVLAAGFSWAGIPVLPAIARAALVLPFSAVFAGVAWLAGDPARGWSLLLKSYISALAVLFVVSTTPLPLLIEGMEKAGAPRFLLVVGQFLYRYLFVISEEAQHMAKAAAARGATLRDWMAPGLRFRAAAGAVAVLFMRSYARAEDVHRAMLARGFSGHFEPLHRMRFGPADAAFAAVASLIPVALRIAAERVVR